MRPTMVSYMSRRRSISQAVGGLLLLGLGLALGLSALGQRSIGRAVGRTEIFPVGADSVSHVEGLTWEYLHQESTHPAVVSLARRITSGLTSDTDKANRLHWFVATQVPFVDDPEGYERMVSPGELAEAILANQPVYEDCDGKAALLSALALAVGIPASVAFMDTDHDGEVDHAISVIVIDGVPVYAETTVTDARLGWRPSGQVISSTLIEERSLKPG